MKPVAPVTNAVCMEVPIRGRAPRHHAGLVGDHASGETHLQTGRWQVEMLRASGIVVLHAPIRSIHRSRGS
jgi:hypothetical protein